MIWWRGGVGVGVGVMWLLVWLSGWPPFGLIIPVDGMMGIMCAHVGQVPNYFSIGGRRFEPRHKRGFQGGGFHSNHFNDFHWYYGKPLNSWLNRTCETEVYRYGVDRDRSGSHIQFCENGTVIRTYLVEQNGRVLRGWLHFEVELTNMTHQGAQFIYAQVRDEHFNAVGEFVSDREQCGTSDTELISPTQYQILPCSAIGPQEPKASQAIFMARKSQYLNPFESAADKHMIPDKLLDKGIHFTWRMGEYWCNRHAKIRLDVHMLPTSEILQSPPTECGDSPGQSIDDFRCRNYRVVTAWMSPMWFGAADIKIEGPLNCTTPALDKNGGLTQEARKWIVKAETFKVESDYVYVNWVTKLTFCQVAGGSSHPTFGGRCSDYESNTPNNNKSHICNMSVESAPGFVDLNFSSYTEYKEKLLENRSILCSQECKLPNKNDSQDLKNIQGFPKKDTSSAKGKAPISYKTLQSARTEQRANLLFYTRKYHGNLCILITMCLIPVSNLLIRYYKETFMHNLALGCAPWFWVHMAVCFWVPVLYQSGHASMQQTIENFGVSESPHATLHRRAGYVFIIVFYLSILLGAFRPLIRATRIISMAIHSVIGFLLYFLAIALIVNSTFIPASPSAKLDECDEEGNLPSGLSFIAWMAIGWLLIDFCFHFLLTAFQCMVDKKYKIVRGGFGLPIVPMLPAESSRDLVGSRLRKLLLLFYIILSVGMTFTTMTAMFVNDEQGECSLGTMSCNLDVVEVNPNSSPFGCSPIAIKYYGKVILKYSTKQ